MRVVYAGTVTDRGDGQRRARQAVWEGVWELQLNCGEESVTRCRRAREHGIWPCFVARKFAPNVDQSNKSCSSNFSISLAYYDEETKTGMMMMTTMMMRLA